MTVGYDGYDQQDASAIKFSPKGIGPWKNELEEAIRRFSDPERYEYGGFIEMDANFAIYYTGENRQWYAQVDLVRVSQMLAVEGWEPFAATGENIMHFKRRLAQHL